MKKVFILSLSLLMSTLILGQDTLNFAEKRFQFAEGAFGPGVEVIPASGIGSFLNSENQKTDFQYPMQVTPRFTISGLHFWRNADFYVTVPIADFADQKVGDADPLYNTGAETGMKIYPFKVKENSARPYLGVSWNLMSYNQTIGEEQGQQVVRSQAPIQFGLTYNRNNKLFEIGGTYNHQNKLDYYLSRDIKTQIELPPLSFHASYRWVFDTSIDDAPEYFDGTIDRQVDKLRSLKKLSSFSFAIGANATFMGANDYNEQNFPFADNLKMSNSHLDLGVGYYFEKPDIHLNLTFRNMPFSTSSYDFQQKYLRRTLGLEAYKFLFDYHGFVPYLGVVPSYEKHRLENTDQGESSVVLSENKWTGGLIFGWDIRQDDRQWYMLRTNLRWFPIQLDIEGAEYSFNQFEFNLIQFVYYPTRHKWIKKARKGKI